MKLFVIFLSVISFSFSVHAGINGNLNNLKPGDKVQVRDTGHYVYGSFHSSFYNMLKNYGLKSLGGGGQVVIHHMKTKIYTVIVPEFLSDWGKRQLLEGTDKYSLEGLGAKIISEEWGNEADYYYQLTLSFGSYDKYSEGNIKRRAEVVSLQKIDEIDSEDATIYCRKSAKVHRFKILSAKSFLAIGEVEQCKDRGEITALCTGSRYQNNCDINIDSDGNGMEIILK